VSSGAAPVSLGALQLLGSFALASTNGTPAAFGLPLERLRRCGSELNLNLVKSQSGGCEAEPLDGNNPIGSPSIVIQSPDLRTLRGWFLPSLRRFTIDPKLHACIEPVGVENRTIYIRTGRAGNLWAATAPSRRRGPVSQ
jgi:hypothetical protein